MCQISYLDDAEVPDADGTFPCFFSNFRSWSMVKQSVDATFEDIRKHELLAELELRVLEVRCSALIMWITPSQRICKGFPMVITQDLHPATTSSVAPVDKDISPNHQNFHLSLYVWRTPIRAFVLTLHVSRVTVAFA